MSSRSRFSRTGLRLGALGVFLAGLAALTMWWQPGRAGGTPFAPPVAAVLEKGELRVAVAVERPGRGALEDDLGIQVLSAAGQPLASLNKPIRQSDAHAQY